MVILRLVVLIVTTCPFVYGQIGFKFASAADKLEVPFVRVNNFIVVKVIIDDALPMNMIFDTGAENTILLKEEIAAVLGLAFDKQKIQVRGAGGDTVSEAQIIRRVKLSLGGAQAIQDLVVFTHSPFDLESKLGISIDGILGADMMRGYQVLIDYKRQRLTIQKPRPIQDKRYVRSPIELSNNRPFINTTVWFTPTDSLQCRLLIDTGADLNLLLYTNSHPAIKIPDRIIPVPLGYALNGTIDGVLGRVYRTKVSDFYFHDIPTHYQEQEWQHQTTSTHARYGLIGNHILSRFQVIIDFSAAALYLKPNGGLEKKFKVDRSGLLIVSPDLNNSTYVISYVIPKSPAREADLRPGDEIVAVNYLPAGWFTMSQIASKLSAPRKKSVALTIRRHGERLKRVVHLRDLI